MAQIYEGIAVFSVEPGTASHRAGVRSGDIVVGVNGRRVRKLADYAQARRLRACLLELVVMRRGRKVQLWAADADLAGQPGAVAAHEAHDASMTSLFRGQA